MKYSTDIVKKICDLIETGDYTQKELCEVVGITEETIITWKREKPEFSELIKKAGEKRIEYFKNIARNSLVRVLQGFEYEETTTEYVNNGSGKAKIKSFKTVKKHCLPNVTAIIFTLASLDKQNFTRSDTPDDQTQKDNNTVQFVVSNAQKKLIDKAIEKFKKPVTE